LCFSTAASFGASAILSVAGVAAVTQAQTKAQRLFAAIPFIFSIQQFFEGLLWLSIKNPDFVTDRSVPAYFFLFFALVLWPVYIPFTIWSLEKDKGRKKILSILLGIGTAISACLGSILLLYPVHVMTANHHIHFSFDLPLFAKNITWLSSLLYFIPTMIAPFISGSKKMKWLGIVFIASYIFSLIFFSGFLVSVWCYFAALLSIVVLWIVWELREPVLLTDF
jgi:hypothetical protein